MFVKNCWYVAAWQSEIGPDALERRIIVGEPILLMRKGNGELIALEDRCSHRFAPLSLGRREGDDIRCMYHGLKFNCAGECIEVPGHDRIPPRLSIQKYPVIERHGAAWLWPGDPTRADPSLIPAVRGPGDAQYRMNASFLDYDVDYQLLNDNLCDFSHISYVHENTFARGEMAWATSPPRLTTLDNGIRFERWLRNTTEPFHMARDLIDVWTTYDYLVPGILTMSSVVYPAGTAVRCGGARPDERLMDEALHAGAYFQAVTPTTEKSARYFFSQGPRHTEDPTRSDAMYAVTVAAFHEDMRMITAQQENIELSAGRRFGAIAYDRGPGHLRVLIARMLKQEAQAGQATSAMPVV